VLIAELPGYRRYARVSAGAFCRGFGKGERRRQGREVIVDSRMQLLSPHKRRERQRPTQVVAVWRPADENEQW